MIKSSIKSKHKITKSEANLDQCDSYGYASINYFEIPGTFIVMSLSLCVENKGLWKKILN